MVATIGKTVARGPADGLDRQLVRGNRTRTTKKHGRCTKEHFGSMAKKNARLANMLFDHAYVDGVGR